MVGVQTPGLRAAGVPGEDMVGGNGRATRKLCSFSASVCESCGSGYPPQFCKLERVLFSHPEKAEHQM